jgi:hypothetical protein
LFSLAKIMAKNLCLLVCEIEAHLGIIKLYRERDMSLLITMKRDER